MTWRIVNSLDLSAAPDAIAALEDVGKLVTVPPERHKVLAEMAQCDAYLASAAVQIDRDFLGQAPHLKVVGSPSTGTDHIDLAALQERAILCFDIAGERELLDTFTATSELTFALALCVVRNIPRAIHAAERGDWARERFAGTQLFGKTFGILGLGRLGTISSQIARGFGMHVIANDIVAFEANGVEMVSFEELLARSDILSLHVHLTNETRGIIDRNAFSRMKSSAVIINTSRGAIVDEAALLNALQLGQVAGAGLDLVDGEWLSVSELEQHPLIVYARSHPNLIITPHIGGSTTESIAGARVFMARKVANAIRQSANSVASLS